MISGQTEHNNYTFTKKVSSDWDDNGGIRPVALAHHRRPKGQLAMRRGYNSLWWSAFPVESKTASLREKQITIVFLTNTLSMNVFL